ncbi:hypothetical protein J7L67_03225 [bacterium]|nr:hypothetical protein [bacterium]
MVPNFFTGQKMRAEGTAEVEYLAVSERHIYPIEVKSGVGGSLKSLHNMLEK